MDILSFIDLLIAKTDQGKCNWENENNEFRLLLKSGAVTFRYSYMYDDTIESYSYTITFFNTVGPFATYNVDNEENYDEERYRKMDNLRKSILDWKERVIMGKMSELAQEISLM